MNRVNFILKISLCFFLCLFFNVSEAATAKTSGSIYNEISGESKPEFTLFENAYLGYIDLKLRGALSADKDILTIVDFRKPSTEKRLWVIDLKNKRVLFHTFVAHGENSGDRYAVDFSNKIASHQSSLGFYITEETYMGKNGLSLKLKGMEWGFNSNAKNRYIVLHGADYATEKYLKHNGKLGVSKGCPAIPMELSKPIIESTEGGTCLFIYFPDSNYIEDSDFIMNIF